MFSKNTDTFYTNENRKNHEKLQELYRISGKGWLEFFHEFFPEDPKELYKTFKRLKKDIKKRRAKGEISYGEQQKILPPNSDEVHSKFLDVSLMRKLVAFYSGSSKPQKFWFDEPPSADQSREANFVRLANLRNIIQHGPGFVTDEEYDRISKPVIDGLIGIGKDKSLFDNLVPIIRYGFGKAMDNFFGREKELTRIHDLIKKGKKNTTRIVVSGFAGVGKSEMVRKYYAKYGETFENNILWINATNKETLEKSFKEIAEEQKLKIREEDGTLKSNEYIVRAVHKYFQYGSVLFVFDDVTDKSIVDPFLPIFNPSSTIITTQLRDWLQPDYQIVELIELDETESKQFLNENLKNHVKLTDAQLNEIISLLKGHLLAMQQFVAFIKKTMFSVDEYIKHFKDQTAKMLSSKIEMLNNETGSSIFAILINIERLGKSSNSDLSCEVITTVR